MIIDIDLLFGHPVGHFGGGRSWCDAAHLLPN